jgi:hypothetical protein
VNAAINTDTPSALCAYATACQRDVVCVAHVINSMAAAGDDFEKGEADGTYRILGVLEVARVGGPAPVRSKGTVADAPDSRAGV